MKKFNISLEMVIDLDGTEDIATLEKKVTEGLKGAGPELVRIGMQTREEQRGKYSKRCLGCGSRAWESRGKVRRKIVTLAGAVSYQRQKLKCVGCGKEIYPLDEELKLEGRRNATLGLREAALWMAVEMPYDRASRGLAKLGGIELSGRQIQSWAKEEGERLKGRKEQERKDLFENGVIPEGSGREAAKRVFVGVDGTFVNERSRPGEIEAKVGIIYSKREKIGENRWKILDKKTFASAEGIEEFREQLILECHRWGVWDAKEIVYVGDGAPWIKRMWRENFPGAIYILDWWHLAENTRRVFGDERKALTEELLEISKRGEGQEFYNRLDTIYRRSRDPDFREKLEKLLEYVKNNMEGIENYKRVGTVGSSGSIEKAVDVTVCRRFKKRGMSWLYPGLSGLLALKLLKLNGEWDAYWKTRGLPS